MKPGRKQRDHKVLKVFGKADDLARIRAYLADVQHVQRLGDRSAAAVVVLLKAQELGLFLNPASMQDLHK